MEHSLDNDSFELGNISDSYNWTNEHVPSVEAMENELFLQNVPAFVFLAIVGIIGVVGNLHVIIVYIFRIKPSNHRILIIFLAVLDFNASIIIIPMNLYHIRYELSVGPFICSLFFPYCLGFSTGVMMLVIAIERFRKVCVPFGRQLTIREVWITCFVLVGMAIILSLPTFIIYNSKVLYSEQFRNNISICAVLQNGNGNIGVRIYCAIPALTAVVSVITCTICYSAIGRFIIRRRKQNDSQFVREENILRKFSIKGPKNETQDVYEAGTETSTELSNGSQDRLDTGANKTTFIVNSKKYQRTVQISYMFLVTTILTYFFYIVSIVFISLRVDESSYAKIKQELGPLRWILAKFVYVGTVINPFVYGFFDRAFRNICVEFYLSKLKYFKCAKR